MQTSQAKTKSQGTERSKRNAEPVSGQRRGRKDRPIIQINGSWRIATDDRLQWIIQKRKGKVWVGSKYLETRSGLVVWLRRLGLFTPSIEVEVMNLPERFPRVRPGKSH